MDTKADEDQASKQLAMYGGMSAYWMKLLTRGQGIVYGVLLVGRVVSIWRYETTDGVKMKRTMLYRVDDLREPELLKYLSFIADLCQEAAQLFS